MSELKKTNALTVKPSSPFSFKNGSLVPNHYRCESGTVITASPITKPLVQTREEIGAWLSNFYQQKDQEFVA